MLNQDKSNPIASRLLGTHNPGEITLFVYIDLREIQTSVVLKTNTSMNGVVLIDKKGR